MSAFYNYREDGVDQLPKDQKQLIFDQEEDDDKEVVSGKICSNYVKYQKFSGSYYFITSLVILIYNNFFYIMTKPIIFYIGFHKETTVNSWSSFTIFFCLFVDMIVLPLIIGMNLIEFYDNKLFETFYLFRGKHTDFGARWYTDIGR